MFFANTQLTAQFFTQNGISPSNLTVVDVDPGAAAPSGPFCDFANGFSGGKSTGCCKCGEFVGR